MTAKHLTYLSLGAGVQSSALLVMSCKGLKDCPRADVAIFADTQGEPQWVYDHLAALEKWSPIPIERVTTGDLEADALHGRKHCKGFVTIPAWTMGEEGRGVPLRRQCTREYKIDPIEKRVKEILGYGYRQRVRATATALIGISWEELMRAKPCRTPWITSAYPLLEARMTRGDCIRLLQEHGLPVPKKSACRFCPYHSDAYWLDLQKNHPHEFEKACHFDEVIRVDEKCGTRGERFLHRGLKPLALVDFTHGGQTEMFQNECEGVCGV